MIWGFQIANLRHQWNWQKIWHQVFSATNLALLGNKAPNIWLWLRTWVTLYSRVSSVVKIRKHLTILTQYRMMNTTSNMKMNRWCQVANLSMDNGSRRREFNFSLRGLDLKVIFVFHHFNKKNFSSAKSSDSHAFLPLIQQQHHPLLQIKPVLNVNIQPKLFRPHQQDQTKEPQPITDHFMFIGVPLPCGQHMVISISFLSCGLLGEYFVDFMWISCGLIGN